MPRFPICTCHPHSTECDNSWAIRLGHANASFFSPSMKSLKSGPSDFNARIVCDRLQVKQSMVPYHFGSRDGLLTEATIWAFRDCARNAIEAARRTTGSGEKRLRAYVNAEVEWARRMGAATLLVHYPMLSEPVRGQLAEKYGDEMRRWLEYHLVVLCDLVIETRTGVRSELNYDENTHPSTESAIRHPVEFLIATSVSLSSHGLQMWSSGAHLSTKSFWAIDLPRVGAGFAIRNHIDAIIATAKGR